MGLDPRNGAGGESIEGIGKPAFTILREKNSGSKI